MKKKKHKNPYLSLRRTWTRNPSTQVLTNRKVYNRQKAKQAVKNMDDSLLIFLQNY